MANQLISIHDFMDELYIHPLMREIPLETVVRYTVNFMRIVGVPNMFDNRVTRLDIHDYRSCLPEDFYDIVSLRRCGTRNAHDNATYRYATDTFHFSSHKDGVEGLTYKIQGGVIYTSTKDDPVELSYLAIPVDQYGYPMIPDNSSFTRALKAFIKKEWFTILMDLGKLHPSVLSNAQQDYAWAVGDCESEFNRLSLDKAESFYNTWQNLVVRANEHMKGFINTGRKEVLRVV